jgi:hypothetical protein
VCGEGGGGGEKKKKFPEKQTNSVERAEERKKIKINMC